MKNLKFMSLALAALVVGFASCNKDKEKEPEIIVSDPDPQEQVKLPTVEATDGAVTLVVKFDVAPCEGHSIVFVGSYKDHSWANENDGETFKAIGDGFYSVVLFPGEDGTISGRVAQTSDEADSWPGYDWSHSLDDLVNLQGLESGIAAANEFGQVNLTFTDAYLGQVIFVESKGWNKVPCADAIAYNVTVKTPAFCEEFEIELVGSFEGWGTNPVALTKSADNVYTATINAVVGDEIKARGVGGWDKEIQTVNDAGEWGGVPNFVLTEETTVVIDYTNAELYRWNICAE